MQKTSFQRVPMRFNVASTNDDVIHQRRGYVRKRVLPTINGESPNGKLHKNRMSFTNAMGLSNSAGSASTGKSSSSSGEQNGYVTTDARYTAARARDGGDEMQCLFFRCYCTGRLLGEEILLTFF